MEKLETYKTNSKVNVSNLREQKKIGKIQERESFMRTYHQRPESVAIRVAIAYLLACHGQIRKWLYKS